jgi:hypothetical protein
MIAILEYHGLVVVPVDLPESFAIDRVLRVDLDQVKRVVITNWLQLCWCILSELRLLFESGMDNFELLPTNMALTLLKTVQNAILCARLN